jgi:TonB family protein
MSDYGNDIEKYLKGELTPSQMHALEKKALNDPFLADALEGAQQLPLQELSTDLNLLNGALNKRLHKTKNVWLWPMRIAAGLLVLAASSYLIISLNNQERRENLALNQQRETAPSAEKQKGSPLVSDSVINENVISESKSQTDPPDDKGAGVRSEEPKPSPSTSSPAQQSLALADKPVEPKEEEKMAVKEFESEIAADVSVEERVAPAPEESPAPVRQDILKRKADADEDDEVTRSKSITGNVAKTEAYSDKVARRIVRGKVTFSEDGTGLPGVNVTVKGSNQGTVTDEQGNYILPLNNPEASLTFSFIGFTSQEIDANSDELNVQLDTDISELNEVEVVGYPTTQDGFLLPNPPPVMELASPAGGRKLFKQYLEQNLRYPKQAIANQVEGKVTIQFSIGATGQLSDFRVIRGIGHGCDEEVIRLVKEGPKWAPTKKDAVSIRDKVKVRMKFALPKKK